MAEPTVDWIKQNYEGYAGWRTTFGYLKLGT